VAGAGVRARRPSTGRGQEHRAHRPSAGWGRWTPGRAARGTGTATPKAACSRSAKLALHLHDNRHEHLPQRRFEHLICLVEHPSRDALSTQQLAQLVGEVVAVVCQQAVVLRLHETKHVRQPHFGTTVGIEVEANVEG